MSKIVLCPFCHRDTGAEDSEDLLNHIDVCHKAIDAVVIRIWPDAAIARNDEGEIFWMEREPDEDDMSRLTSCHPVQRQRALLDVLHSIDRMTKRTKQLRRAAEFLAREVPPGGTITIEVRGGNLEDVTGLPEGWDYTLIDWDTCPTCGMQGPECPDCKERNR